ncbi:MAG TPA: metallophosphoesterase [Allosphingosinicella sp.]
MAIIAHLSDIHFGRHDPVIVRAVEDLLSEKRPNLVVISGDFTQRARTGQYELACRFLARLQSAGLAVLSVPGNHDIPLYDVTRRFLRPLHRYRRFIDTNPCPWFENDEVAVLGINTARSLTTKHGSVSHAQMQRIREAFGRVSEEKTHILVTHHPLFAMPIGEEGGLTRVADRSHDAIAVAAEAGVDMLLAGHFHRSFSSSAREMVDTAGPALVIQAGTATSTRLRGEERQSFNWIETSGSEIRLQVLSWHEDSFKAGPPAGFVLADGHWRSAPTDAPAAATG